MPGYEPFLLCDFHVHTNWSDGRLSLREVVDLYGRTRRFDVIAVTDHILMRRDLLARSGRLLTLGRVVVRGDCWVWTSARRYRAMGKLAVFGLYVRNFWSEIVRHRPADRDHLDVRV